MLDISVPIKLCHLNMGHVFCKFYPYMQSVKKKKELSISAQSDFDYCCCLFSVIVHHDVSSPLTKNKMTFLMAKILDQFRQMAFEFLPHDVMVSFHFQIWP